MNAAAPPRGGEPPESAAPPRRFRRLRLAAGIFGLLLALDWLQPPARQLSTLATLAAIDLYQATLSPLMPGLGVHCRFTPTCSHYGEETLRCVGLPRGASLVLWRILRCGAWTPAGTYDPPPCGAPAPAPENAATAP